MRRGLDSNSFEQCKTQTKQWIAYNKKIGSSELKKNIFNPRVEWGAILTPRLGKCEVITKEVIEKVSKETEILSLRLWSFVFSLISKVVIEKTAKYWPAIVIYQPSQLYVLKFLVLPKKTQGNRFSASTEDVDLGLFSIHDHLVFVPWIMLCVIYLQYS